MHVHVLNKNRKHAVYVRGRPAIPNCITEEVRTALPTAVFTSNPCRLQYCTQEIVIFREDIVMKMCRNCVRYPADGNIPMHVISFVIAASADRCSFCSVFLYGAREYPEAYIS